MIVPIYSCLLLKKLIIISKASRLWKPEKKLKRSFFDINFSVCNQDANLSINPACHLNIYDVHKKDVLWGLFCFQSKGRPEDGFAVNEQV